MNIDIILSRQTLGHESCDESFAPPRAARCGRCGGETEEGFLLERQLGFEPAATTVWHAGTAARSAWAGLQPEPDRQRSVSARRCTHCGGLDLFAL